MSQLKQTESGTFICKDEYIDGIKIQSFLGIPYAKSERFGIPEMTDTYRKSPANYGIGLRFPQNDVPPFLNLFLKNPMMRKEILTDSDKTDENAFVLNIWTNDTQKKNLFWYSFMEAGLPTVPVHLLFTTAGILQQKT